MALAVGTFVLTGYGEARIRYGGRGRSMTADKEAAVSNRISKLKKLQNKWKQPMK